ncbi:MAG: cell division protein FtsX [Bacteroidetes bacterium]|nr:MAG: cell division protein FtsX [Bacteroidota bacterium]
MLKNYLKTAIRNLWKNKGFSALNILGLSIGLATCLLITFYVIDELSFDRFNKKAERIYRVDADIQFGGNHFILAVAPEPLGPTLKREFPQVEQAARMRPYGSMLVRKGNVNLNEDKVVYADSTLFDVFTLPMIEGDPQTALKDPNSVVITETIAKKYFDRATNVVGKTLIKNDSINLKVTGVLKDIPKQSHFNFDFFIAMNGAIESWEIGNWLSNNHSTYIVLKPDANIKFITEQINVMLEKYVAPQAMQLMQVNMEDFKKSGNHDNLSLTPLTDIHLQSNKTAELGANSSIQYVYIFSAIAIFILLIACVNFMNLSTARSSNRAKEVGVRKVLGSLKNNLISQFLTESTFLCFVSMIIGLLIAWALLPYFNQVSGKHIEMALLSRPWIVLGLIALVIVVGLLAGSYPAFVLSSFQPIVVLKGKLAAGFKNKWLRGGLVVFQFFISIVLIIGTIIIYTQLNYIRNKDLGFNREQVLVIKGTSALGNQARAFKDDVLKINGVQSGTMTGFLPTSGWRTDNPLFPDASLNQKTAVSAQNWRVDEDYIPTLGMKMSKGRNFSKEFQTDSTAVILNESAAKLFGFTDPINKSVYTLTNFPAPGSKQFHVVGVVKDFNFNSLREQVSPLVLFLSQENGSMAFRLNTANITGIISKIESDWTRMAPSQPFSYSFMDDDFNNIYNSEQRIGKIFVSFAILAIFIACLGLFGLVTYAAEQRRREIGIRKVLGASVGNIIGMLSKDFLWLVLISAIIAFPIAWWSMNKWLQDFAYRIHISWWIFVFAAILAMLIACITVGFQAFKAAISNPVKSLRTE